MIALAAHRGKSLVQKAKFAAVEPFAITRSLEKITLTPNFGQAQVTLDCEIISVASRPGWRKTGFLSPPAPRAWPAGPVEFRVRFNPQTTSGRF